MMKMHGQTTLKFLSLGLLFGISFFWGVTPRHLVVAIEDKSSATSRIRHPLTRRLVAAEGSPALHHCELADRLMFC